MSVDKAVGVVLAAGLVAGCGANGNGASAQTGGGHYDALVRRTAMGIPHIKAGDFGSLGYGLGYAQAEDNLCVLLDDILTDRGERSQYFGPDGTYTMCPTATPRRTSTRISSGSS